MKTDPRTRDVSTLIHRVQSGLWITTKEQDKLRAHIKQHIKQQNITLNVLIVVSVVVLVVLLVFSLLGS